METNISDNEKDLKKKLHSLRITYQKHMASGFSREAFFLLEEIHNIESLLGLELTRC